MSAVTVSRNVTAVWWRLGCLKTGLQQKAPWRSNFSGKPEYSEDFLYKYQSAVVEKVETRVSLGVVGAKQTNKKTWQSQVPVAEGRVGSQDLSRELMLCFIRYKGDLACWEESGLGSSNTVGHMGRLLLESRQELCWAGQTYQVPWCLRSNACKKSWGDIWVLQVDLQKV